MERKEIWLKYTKPIPSQNIEVSDTNVLNEIGGSK